MGRLQRQHHVGKAPPTAEITAGNAPSAQCPPPQDHHRADHGRRGARRGHSRRVLRSQGVPRHQGPQRRRHLLRAGLQRSGIRVRGVHRLAGREPVQHRQASRRGRSGQVRGRVHRCLIGYDAVPGHLSRSTNPNSRRSSTPKAREYCPRKPAATSRDGWNPASTTSRDSAPRRRS